MSLRPDCFILQNHILIGPMCQRGAPTTAVSDFSASAVVTGRLAFYYLFYYFNIILLVNKKTIPLDRKYTVTGEPRTTT